ncbi:MAG: 3-isopropylmalate dehydratase large subunit [Candidatus Theseobacter exili]|nr:3-isopropylmalate dehydratase large subunit [Candidatus Theseobacter exili]
MGMTITEKILAVHAGKEKVYPGEFLSCKVDIALGNDITAPIAIAEFRKADVKKVFDPAKIALVPDHFTPNKDIASAENSKILREFAREHEISHYYEIGKVGIEHVLLPELGVVVPGDMVIGADSHTCTYGALGAFSTGVGSTDLAACMATGTVWIKVPETIKIVFQGKLGPWVSGKDLILFLIGQIGVDGARYNALEFTGPVIDALGMSDRFTIANMAIEAGAKNGIFIPDDITRNYVNNRAERLYDFYKSDPDAKYIEEFVYDVSDMEPQVAFPHLPENARPISKVGTVAIDQSVIGSCTNGRLEDFRQAAKVLKGNNVDSRVRLLIFPGTQQVYLDAMNEGLLEIFIRAGGVISPPTCGPCLGGHMGVLAKGERAIATTNRNFVGRMGHPESEVYLSNPAIAAASAVLGRIGSPDEL